MFNFDISKIVQLLQFDKRDPLLFGSSLFFLLFIGVLVILQLLNKNVKLKFAFLTLFSFYFYYKASGALVSVLAAVAVGTYILALGIRKFQNTGVRRLLLILGLLGNIGALGYFKYTNFILQAIAQAQQKPFEALQIIVPLGISFYVFKAISYLFDVYWEFFEEDHSFWDFLLYITFFTNLLSGPIDRATSFIPQLKQNPTDSLTNEDIGRALFLIMLGLLKKYVIADYIGLNLVDRVFDAPVRFTGIENLIALYGYTLQIFCDFSGYTDMAIGIALLMGFRLMENFNFPYKATSVADFWRRWHISLSSWLQDYLFKPIQLSVRRMRILGNIIAIVVTFIICGVWHGASWGFIIWGALHAFYMSFSVLIKVPKTFIYEKLHITKLKVLPVIQTIITFHLIMFAWLFFRMPNLDAVKEVLNQMVTFLKPDVAIQFIGAYPVIIVLMVIGYVLHFLPGKVYQFIESLVIKAPLSVRIVMVTVVIWIVSQFRFADIVPFIYFQF
ncbi:MAG: MBOAT family protein [Ignavibacteria bacterium]|nr:MBOAT family protein [Ignavibacteria bacterium]